MDFHRRNMLHSKEKLGTGCEELDQCLQGGISTREICEISGTAFTFLFTDVSKGEEND